MSKILGSAYQINEDWSICPINKCGSSMLKLRLCVDQGRRPIEAGNDLPTKGGIFIVRHPLRRIESYWRDFVYRMGRMPHNHATSIKSTLKPSFEELVWKVLNTPDAQRDVHLCSYGRFTACAEEVLPVALENIAGSWPKDIELPFDPSKKDRESPKAETPLSDELKERFEDAFHADFLLWEEAIARIEDE